MVDNINLVRDMLKFDNPEEFYYISIMQRNKDGVKVASSHDNCRRIRTFYVFSLEEFDRVVPFIKEICDKINARCYIEMNRKNIFQCQLECIKRLAECIEHRTTKSRAIMDSVVAGAPSKDKLWMVDIDGHRPGGDELVDDIIDYVGYHKGKFLGVLPTVNGCHIITSRFDPREFNFKDAELKRNAFTLLYYNDISRKQE
jgi:hypothetical protein